MSPNELTSLGKSLRNGDRRSLARAITLIESNRSEDRSDAEKLLTALMPATGKSKRIGISGSPGVGKSSLIEKLGLYCVAKGLRIAVLAVDPSSPITGGSILGDKTRMEELSRHEMAFIRPSPSGSSNGGVSRHTRESILLCEAAGFDLVIIETIGVGQAEYTVASMVDTFIVLQLPGSGDDLQGIKKGILELADILVINKADGPQESLARQAKSEHEQAFMLVRSGAWIPPVLLTSAERNFGIDQLFDNIMKHTTHLEKDGHLLQLRKSQAQKWFKQELIDQLKDWFENQESEQSWIAELETDVTNLKLPAPVAARKLISKLILKNV